jgi:uncharacterized Zn finger protein
VSRWDDSRWPRPAPKKPPPAHGIKMQKAGVTWWGQRWIEALEDVLRGDSSRLARGRTYARAGRTHDLVIQAGKVTAQVTGSRPRPYKIEIQLAQLSKAAWTKAIAGMAEKAQFAAELLAGQMPREIDDVFRAAGASLFPKQRAELVTSCSCPDWGDPCKHVAATHYVLGEALDRDPFLLFELRGRGKAQVLDALRVARAGAPTPTPDKRPPTNTKKRPTKKEALSDVVEVTAPEPEVRRVTLGKLEPADYDRAREPLPALHFSFDAPPTHGALLRQLGLPATWTAGGSPSDSLAPLIHRAAEAARRIAMAEPEPQAAPPGEREPEIEPDERPLARSKKALSTARRARPKPRTRNRAPSENK